MRPVLRPGYRWHTKTISIIKNRRTVVCWKRFNIRPCSDFFSEIIQLLLFLRTPNNEIFIFCICLPQEMSYIYNVYHSEMIMIIINEDITISISDKLLVINTCVIRCIKTYCRVLNCMKYALFSMSNC